MNRQERRANWLGDTSQGLRYAARKLVAAPAFSLAAVATLTIGIGATTAIFSTVNATLLRPLPYDHPDELIALRTRYADGRVTTGLVAAAASKCGLVNHADAMAH